jgi:hypothetical protein
MRNVAQGASGIELQVVVGGVLVFLAGLLIGSA